MLTHLDLFAGIGGFSLAARACGIKTTHAVEIKPFQRSVFAHHFPECVLWKDIRVINPIEKGWDIISCGFPCQDISGANHKGKGLDGDRSGLWKEGHRIIKDSQPKFALIENVANLRHRGLGRVVSDLAAIGYVGEWQTVGAAHIGAPHLRKRILIVAYPNELQPRLQGKETWASQIRQEIAALTNTDNLGAWWQGETQEQKRADTADDPRPSHQTGGSTQSRSAVMDDGIPQWVSEYQLGGWWANNPAPTLCGIPRKSQSKRYEQLECIGNAVVPGVALLGFKRILYLNRLLGE
ncbi:DNA cytosine methyltransferase [Scytonema hofmannii]|uniref:DNA cytosine methyltransferase n=1 Tax=Scytonema hofmannii TaxID=34078 RepID=UPI00037F55EE